MTQHKAKAILIGRKKHYEDNPDVRPCFISLFNENNPHKSAELPFDVLEFEKIHKVVINELNVNYLLPGNDLVINDIDSFEVKMKGTDLFLKGKHKQ